MNWKNLTSALHELAGGSPGSGWDTIAALKAVAAHPELLDELDAGLRHIGLKNESKRRLLQEQMQALNEADANERKQFLESMRSRFDCFMAKYP